MRLSHVRLAALLAITCTAFSTPSFPMRLSHVRLAALLAITCTAFSTPSISTRPNLIFLHLDDMDSMLGALDVMPTYVDRFVRGGATFSHSYVGSPKCCPSRTSMLSGRFAHRLGDQALGWCGDFISAARYKDMFIGGVRAAGYRTGVFGKLVNIMGPMCEAPAPLIPAGLNVSAGDAFVVMCNESAYYSIQFNRNGKLHTTGASGDAEYLQAFIGNESIPWLESAAAEAASPGGRPFFAFLAPHSPHLPAEPAPWYADAPLPHNTAPRPPSFGSGSQVNKSWAIMQNPPFDALTTAGIDTHFRNRQRTLMSVDDYVRDIFRTLEAAGVSSNTYVLASSDHGYHLGEWGLPFEKSTPYETDVRTPLYAVGPGVVPGSTLEGMASLMDIGATFLDLAGASPPGSPRASDGISLVPLLLASGSGGAWPASSPRAGGALLLEHLGEKTQFMTACQVVFNMSGCGGGSGGTEYLIDGAQNTWAQLRIINASANLAYVEFRDIKAPLARASTNWTELYDLRTDPFQRVNLAQQVGMSGLVALLSEQLWRIANCTLDSCP